MEIVAVGDTASRCENFITGHLQNTGSSCPSLLLHLGDLCYDNDTQRPFATFTPSEFILVPGCREMISFNYHALWGAEQIGAYFTNPYYTRKIILDGYTVKIIVVHAYIVPGSKTWYNIIDWLAIEVASDERFKIICSHVPPYSVSRHGPDYLMRRILTSAQVHGKFHLYLSGHEHCYQHFQIKGTDYLVNGLGGKGTYDFYSESSDLVARYNEKPAILKLHITYEGIDVRLINSEQQVVHTFQVKR
jgi:hypothetical protein